MYTRHLCLATSSWITHVTHPILRISLNRPVPVLKKYRGVSSLASRLPTVVHHKKDVGDITIRPMTEDDLTGVYELIKSRNLTDFSESDIYSVSQSEQFVGILASNKENEIVGFGGVLQLTDLVWSGGHHFVAQKYQRSAIGSDIYVHGKKYLPTKQGSMLVGYSYAFLKDFLNQNGQYLDMKLGTFVRLVGQSDIESPHELEDRQDYDIVNITEVNFHHIAKYDKGVHILQRDHILHAMCFHSTVKGYAAIGGDDFKGFTMLKKCQLGYKIAPLYADNSNIANTLYQKAVCDIPQNSTVSIIMLNNDFTENFIRRNRFDIQESVYRHYATGRQFPFNVDYSKVFGLTDTHWSIC